MKFETYWTKTFDYFNITTSKNDPKFEQLGKDNESMFCDPDFKMDDDAINKVKIDSEITLNKCLAG
jgi:hypothetical protein